MNLCQSPELHRRFKTQNLLDLLLYSETETTVLPHRGPPRSSRASTREPEHPPSGPRCQGCKKKGLAAEADSPAASPDGPSPTYQTRHNKETERIHAVYLVHTHTSMPLPASPHISKPTPHQTLNF